MASSKLGPEAKILYPCFKLGYAAVRSSRERVRCCYVAFKNASIIHEQNTKEIVAVKESFYVIKHTCIFTKRLPYGYKMDRF